MSEKAKKRFTIFDVLIGAAIMLILGAIAYVLIISPTTKTVGEKKTLEFVVGVQDSALDVLSLMSEGDSVTISEKSVATLKGVTYEPARQLVPNQTSGEYVLSTIPDRYDISVTVSGDATENDQNITIGNTPIKVGASVSIEGKGYALSGYILDMTLFDTNGEEIKND